MVILIVLIMMILIIMMIIMILPMMMNTEKLGVLEHCLNSLIVIRVLQEEEIITENIRIKEIDMKIYHQQNILKRLDHI